MNDLKQELIERARQMYGDITPCHRKTFEECFTTHGEFLLFWFNSPSGSTMVVKDRIPETVHSTYMEVAV